MRMAKAVGPDGVGSSDTTRSSQILSEQPPQADRPKEMARRREMERVVAAMRPKILKSMVRAPFEHVSGPRPENKNSADRHRPTFPNYT